MRQHSSSGRVVELALPRDPTCAARARDAVRARLAAEVDAETRDAAVLVASELATNAWKHGTGVIRLCLERRADRLRIEVVDDGHGQTRRIRARSGDSDGGFGLQLVEDISLAWGCFEGTTHVWAELPIG